MRREVVRVGREWMVVYLDRRGNVRVFRLSYDPLEGQ